MIKKCISKTFNDQMHTLECMKDLMEIEAIKDDGIYSTFEFDKHWLKAPGLTKTTLRYCKFDGDGCSWLPIRRNIFYTCCPELGNITLPCIGAESLKAASDRIKMDMAKKYNAIWSTIEVQPCHDHFDVYYEKTYVDNKPDYVKYAEADAKATEEAYKAMREDPNLTTSRYLRASDLEIENTKRTLQRLRENSYYGLYPRYFDEKAKEDLKASLEIWKAKADLDIHSPSKELLFNYYNRSHAKEEKEKKDMNVTLMVVPNGMNKDFVNRVKANFQSSNSQRLFVASTDIDYDGKHETYKPLKTKYDLFENWVKTGKVDVVYFMLGFEKDPDTRAFEAFVRGITEAEVPGKIDVRVAYQADDIVNDMNTLRTLYFDKADAIEDLRNAGDKVVKEAMTMSDVYGLDSKCLDAIKNSKGRIDASEEFVMGKIMNTAFASGEDTKPAKKGGKKND